MVKCVTAVVLVVSVGAIGLGLVSPDGAVRGSTAPKPSVSPSPSESTPPEPAPSPSTEPPPADPASLSPVTGVWPGRPAGAVETNGAVDWCGAVEVSVSAAASAAVGDESARLAACRAVAFTFDVRYSTLSLPRQSYAPADFDVVLPHLSSTATEATYPSRIAAVVASPRSTAAREGTGVVLLNGPGPGSGRSYFGQAWSLDGYTGRPVWVDPTWSTVRVELQRSGSRPLLTVSFDASAAVPVWNPATSGAEKLTVATSGTYVMAGPDWRINGWTLRTDTRGFTALN